MSAKNTVRKFKCKFKIYLLQSAPVSGSSAHNVWNWLVSFPPRSVYHNTVFSRGWNLKTKGRSHISDFQ